MTRPCLTLCAMLLAALPVRAQVTERPLAFDTASRVPTITPSLAERLQLGPPLWPVAGRFVSAQLFSRSSGGFTLVVTRPDGAYDRYDLSADAAAGLRSVVETALASGQRSGVGEQTSVASEPAGNAFVRNQAALGLLLYGPAAAVLVGGSSNSGSAALAAEIITAGGVFAAALGRRNMSPAVTTAQNHLSTHAAIHGALLGEALLYVAAGDSRLDASAHGGALLAGSIGGTLFGLRAARTMTDAEAASSAFAADFAALGSLGIMGAAGVFDHSSSARPAVGVASAALVGGYLSGASYPRRARYTVTDGDVRALSTATLIGIGVAAVPFIDQPSLNGRALAGALTGGMVLGAFAGDRWLVRPRDHTRSEATLLWTGAAVGAFVGGGIASIAKSSARPAAALTVGGALLGTIATELAISPQPAGRRALSLRGAGGRRTERSVTDGDIARESRPRRAQITFDPIGAVFAATSRRGTFSVVRASF